MNLGKNFLQVFKLKVYVLVSLATEIQEGLKIVSRNFKQMNSEPRNKPTSPNLPRHNKRNKQYKYFISHTWFISCSCSWRFLTMPSSAGISVPRGMKGRPSSCFSRTSFNSACSLKFKELSSARYFFNRDFFFFFFNNWSILYLQSVHTIYF